MTQFRYFRMPGGRRATAAYDIKQDGETVTIHAGISYRSPRDKYIKGYGEAKAKGRLTQIKMADGFNLVRQDPEKYVVLTINNQPQEKVVQEFETLLEIIVRGFVPAAERSSSIGKGNG